MLTRVLLLITMTFAGRDFIHFIFKRNPSRLSRPPKYVSVLLQKLHVTAKTILVQMFS